MSGNRIAERKAAKLPCEWLVAKSGCSGALSFKRRWNTGDLQAEVRPSLPISLGKGPRPVKRLLVQRLGISVDMALAVPGFKVRDPADTPGRISGSSLPARSSSCSQTPVPACFRIHQYPKPGDTGKPALWAACATAAAVYEETGLSIPPLCEICASRHPSQMNSRRPRRIAVR